MESEDLSEYGLKYLDRKISQSTLGYKKSKIHPTTKDSYNYAL